MAEDSITTAGEDTATESGEQANQAPDELRDPGKKALQEERAKARKATRELAEAQARLKEFEDRDKTELQKLTEAQQTAEQRAAAAEQALARYRVATAKGVPADLVDRLRGDTEDELAADADRLLEVIGVRRPPNFDGGARTTAAAAPDMNALIRQAAGRQ
ncbi:capsid assembly scaffolding protein Gp46 family protein [Micromonospora robiginosa]|uniref:DUF4355 domain-containing protein n=1 Tax=Micromonospora robiginosa TaxID=2749844 RepID=A0A7L6B7M9_9ACTN|nr:DUF4355 domain-containing protein [Micromonospora ferruginea]QLQ37982.1 DUF4355 domain-containing protein [Micromonospora ferruginea]